jgi:hypothetical protein
MAHATVEEWNAYEAEHGLTVVASQVPLADLTGLLEPFVPLVDLEEGACQVCHETGTVDDPVGHFKSPTQFGAYVMAHGDCGESHGLELA